LTGEDLVRLTLMRHAQSVANAGGLTQPHLSALRSERDQLQASIEDLTQRGGRIKLNSCGNSWERKRLCVLVDQTAGRFGNAQSGEIYMIAKGY
jgi:hypothetical protein